MKHIHIPISDIIGDYIDDWGWTYPGFKAYMIDWFAGIDPSDNSVGAPDLEKVTLHINSPGGCVIEGFAIYNKLLSLKEKGVEVEVIIESECYSIATIIALAASPGQLKARQASMWMIHSPWGGAQGNADEMRKYAQYLDAHEKPMIALYMARTGKTEEIITALMKEERFMNATDAKAEGFLDEVLSTAAPAAVNARTMAKKAVAFYKPQSNQVQSNTMAITKEEKAGIVSDVLEGIKAFFGKDGNKPKPAAQAAVKNDKPKAKAKPKPKAQEVEEPMAVSTETADGAEIYYEGELEQGTEVFADAELTEALEDGEYDLADGRTIEVVDGAVANITEAEEEEEEEDDDAGAAAATAKKATPKAKAGKEANPLEAEVKALKAQVAKLSKQVPGSGNAGPKGAQTFTEGGKKKTANDPWAKVAGNIKKKYGKAN